MAEMSLILSNHDALCNLLSGAKGGTSGISDAEVAHLAWLGSQVPNNGRVVEVGSNQGKSICCIASGIKAMNNKAEIICVDLWTDGAGKTAPAYCSRETWDTFNKQIRDTNVDDLITPLVSDSLSAAKHFQGQIDLLFIDAGHSYRDVLADFRAWSGFVRSGGWIAFHDYGTRLEGVTRVVDSEVASSHEWTNRAIVNRIWSGVRV